MFNQIETNSTLNSSTALLAAGATFTGEWETSPFPELLVRAHASHTGTLKVQFSYDTSNPRTVHEEQVYTIELEDVEEDEVHRLVKGSQSVAFRVLFTNTGAETQTVFRLKTSMGQYGVLTYPMTGVVEQDADSVITRPTDPQLEIASGKFEGYTLVARSGINFDVDTGSVPEDIWNGGGPYTGFPTSGSAETLSVVSDSSDDASAGTGARTVTIYGLDSNYSIQQETVTLNGLTPVITSLTFRRVNGVHTITAGSGGTNAGAITVKHSTTTANVFAVVPAGYGQSQLCTFCIPVGYTGYLMRYSAEMGDNTANAASMALWTREFGKAVRLQKIFRISTASQIDRTIYGGISLPEKTDLALRCTSVQNSNGIISGAFELVLIRT